MIVVRVYGIVINDQRQVLVSDELIRGGYYTKFCGGGLEKGEGTIDCLVREFREEMDLPVKVLEHIYTTDFYQQSAFNPDHQILSVYYLAEPLEKIKAPLRDSPFAFDKAQMLVYDQMGSVETFRFVDKKDFSADTMTLPIDKIVADIIRDKYL